MSWTENALRQRIRGLTHSQAPERWHQEAQREHDAENAQWEQDAQAARAEAAAEWAKRQAWERAHPLNYDADPEAVEGYRLAYNQGHEPVGREMERWFDRFDADTRAETLRRIEREREAGQ